MKAFRYDTHGDLVPCADFGEQFHESLPVSFARTPPAPTSKRERRRWARRGRGPHRSRARPVVAVVSLRERLSAVPIATLRGHLYHSNGGPEAWLYLADDAKPTVDDDERMSAVVRGCQQPGKPSPPLTEEAVLEVLHSFRGPPPDAITVAPDLRFEACEMFVSSMRYGGTLNALRGLLRVEVDNTLPKGRWKISRTTISGRAAS